MAASVDAERDLGLHKPDEVGKWTVAASVMLGAFISVMDSTVVNVALPHMVGSFGTDLLTITWVATAYSIASIIMITMAGWWSTVIGRKRLYLVSMVVFLIGSILAGTSRTLGQMIFYRVLQGLGGGALIPISQAIVREKFPPEEQGMAIAVFTMGIILAPAIGPVIGGYLIDKYGWPSIFYINVPFCILGILFVSWFVYDPSYLKRGVEKIDAIGIFLLTVGMVVMQIVLERGQEVNWFSSHWILVGTVVAVLALVGLVIWEWLNPEPIINFRMFKNFLLSVGTTYSSMVGFALFGSSFILPALVEQLLDYPALQAGLVLIPRSITMMLMMPIVGKLYNYVNPRILVTIGVVSLGYAYWKLGHLALSVGFMNFFPWLVLAGFGMSCSSVVVSTIALSTVAHENMTQASALGNLCRRVSGNIAYAVLATILARRVQFHRARLVTSMNPLNPNFAGIDRGISSAISGHGVNMAHGHLHTPGLLVINGMLNRQSMMMAYNDVYCLLSFVLLSGLLIIMLLPNKGVPDAIEAPIE